MKCVSQNYNMSTLLHKMLYSILILHEDLYTLLDSIEASKLTLRQVSKIVECQQIDACAILVEYSIVLKI